MNQPFVGCLNWPGEHTLALKVKFLTACTIDFILYWYAFLDLFVLREVG